MSLWLYGRAANRQDATDARIGAAHTLFEKLTKLCAAGNTAWRFEDETKADEYVADSAPAAPEVKPG